MDVVIEFIFRKKLYRGSMLLEDSEFPCLVFVFVRDEELVKEFGDEIILKTDFENLLPKKDDYPELIELRKTVFAIAKNTERFLQAKQKWQAGLKANNKP